MIAKRLLTILVFALPVLVLAFAVVMGAQALSRAMGDAPGALVLDWTGVVVLMLLVIDVLLLVGALGLNALASEEEEAE